LHCSKCGQRIPRGDHTVCPNCGLSLKYGKEQRDPSGQKSIKSKTNLSRYSYAGIIGVALMISGFGIVFLYPFPTPSNVVPPAPYEELLLFALISGILGIAFVIISAAHAFLLPSNRRLKERAQLTVYDAMRSGIALPTWWRWWYATMPVVILIIVQSAAHFSSLIYWGAIFIYSGGWIAYVYLVSKRWVERQS
jgi:hypothetical protein